MPGRQAGSGGCKYNAERPKRAAKGLTLRNDDFASLSTVGLINLCSLPVYTKFKNRIKTSFKESKIII